MHANIRPAGHQAMNQTYYFTL